MVEYVERLRGLRPIDACLTWARQHWNPIAGPERQFNGLAVTQ